MTHHDTNSTPLQEVLWILADNGVSSSGRALERLMDAAMKLERSEFLNAQPYERNDERVGHANGFKPKMLRTRNGKRSLLVPQVWNLPEGADGFCPTVLDRGVRSERALKLAIAEMYVHGVSTRRVMAVTEYLCGFEVTSSQVSRAAQEIAANDQCAGEHQSADRTTDKRNDAVSKHRVAASTSDSSADQDQRRLEDWKSQRDEDRGMTCARHIKHRYRRKVAQLLPRAA